MTALDKIIVVWQEDGSATALARVCARDATGAATTIDGEGNFVKQADLSTITCKVFDRSSSLGTPDTAIASPTVTVSSAILNTPTTDNVIWDMDDIGYNFVYDLAGTCFPTANHKYLVEFAFVTTGGSTWVIAYEGIASPVVST